MIFLVVCGLCDSLVSCACSSFEPLDALTAQALRAWHDVHACNVAQSDGATPPALEVLVTVNNLRFQMTHVQVSFRLRGGTRGG